MEIAKLLYSNTITIAIIFICNGQEKHKDKAQIAKSTRCITTLQLKITIKNAKKFAIRELKFLFINNIKLN